MTTGKALLIAGGVAVGGYLLLELISSKSATSPARNPVATDLAWVNPLLSFLGPIVKSSTTPTPNPSSSYSNGFGIYDPRPVDQIPIGGTKFDDLTFKGDVVFSDTDVNYGEG